MTARCRSASGSGSTPTATFSTATRASRAAREQWTVRASRRLADAPDELGAGPLGVRDRRAVCSGSASRACPRPTSCRCRSRSTGPSPPSAPPVLEARDHHARARGGFRLDTDLLRYHQSGLAAGWVEVDGERTEITAATTGSRRATIRGAFAMTSACRRPTSSRRTASAAGVAFRFSWSPMVLQRADGSYYAMHHQYRRDQRVRLRGASVRGHRRGTRRQRRADRGAGSGCCATTPPTGASSAAR